LADDERLFDLICPYLAEKGSLSEAESQRVKAALPHMKDRGSTLIELAAAFDFLRVKRPLELNKNARKALSDEGKDRLKGLFEDLQRMSQWSGASISETIKSYCAATGLSMGQIGPPLRAALTGGLPAPDLAPVMEWLGREETLARIEDQLAG
jgi:glutamyl-tRNA synthetase